MRERIDGKPPAVTASVRSPRCRCRRWSAVRSGARQRFGLPKLAQYSAGLRANPSARLGCRLGPVRLHSCEDRARPLGTTTGAVDSSTRRGEAAILPLACCPMLGGYSSISSKAWTPPRLQHEATGTRAMCPAERVMLVIRERELASSNESAACGSPAPADSTATIGERGDGHVKRTHLNRSASRAAASRA